MLAYERTGGKLRGKGPGHVAQRVVPVSLPTLLAYSANNAIAIDSSAAKQPEWEWSKEVSEFSLLMC